MAGSLLHGTEILAVDDEPDVLKILEEEIVDACPKCTLDNTASFEAASALLNSKSYYIIMLYITGVRGFHLLTWPKKRP